MNPNGLVPIIDDDGFVLWESQRDRALPRGASTPLARCGPPTIRVRADADRWMDWQRDRLCSRALQPIFWNLVRIAPPDSATCR